MLRYEPAQVKRAAAATDVETAAGKQVLKNVVGEERILIVTLGVQLAYDSFRA